MSDKQYEVVGLGACGVDLRARVPRLPVAGNKVTAESLEVSGGGVTANNLIQAAKLGLSTAWIGGLGNDVWKEEVLTIFRNAGVETFAVKYSDSPTQQFWIAIEPSGLASIMGVPGASRRLSAEDVRRYGSQVIARARHFHTEVGILSLEAVLEGARIAYKNGVKVLLDIDGDPWYLLKEEKLGNEGQLKELLSLTSVVKLSESGLLGLLQEKEFSSELLRRVLKWGPSLVVVTLAEQGCQLTTETENIFCSALAVEAHDTVGAGDAFMGGLSYALLQDWDLEKVGNFANACGAYKVAHFGTQSSGNLEEVEALIG